MNNKLLITLTLTFLFEINNLSAFQHIAGRSPIIGKQLNAKDIYITHHGVKTKMNNIDLKNVIALFGKPIRIKKEKWEVNDAICTRTFIYPDGELIIEDNYLAFVTIKKAGWGFSFKTNKGFIGPFTVGTGYDILKTLYPGSYHKVDSGVSLQIKDCDCSLGFDISDTKITAADFFTDET